MTPCLGSMQIFKAFFKEIPEPVLCYDVYDGLIAASKELEVFLVVV